MSKKKIIVSKAIDNTISSIALGLSFVVLGVLLSYPTSSNLSAFLNPVLGYFLLLIGVTGLFLSFKDENQHNQRLIRCGDRNSCTWNSGYTSATKLVWPSRLHIGCSHTRTLRVWPFRFFPRCCIFPLFKSGLHCHKLGQKQEGRNLGDF